MKEACELANLIKERKGKCAERYLFSLEASIPCKKYTDALRKIALVKGAEILNDTVKGFYVNAESLAEELFGKDASLSGTIDFLVGEIKKTEKEDKERAFLIAKDFIDAEFSKPDFSLEKAAEHAGVPRGLLAVLFEERLGITPSEYTAALRIKVAERLLKEGKSVSETAGEAGFLSVQTFIRTFKRINEVTPGSWKRNKLFL